MAFLGDLGGYQGFQGLRELLVKLSAFQEAKSMQNRAIRFIAVQVDQFGLHRAALAIEIDDQ